MSKEVLEPVLASLCVISYDGEVDETNQAYEGMGVAVLDNECSYEGSFVAGLLHGRGRYTWPNGVTYEGSFSSGMMNGKGIFNWPDGSAYEGDIEDGKRHGFGLFKCSAGQIYEGQWEKGKRHGTGTMSYNEKSLSVVYSGEWRQGLRHGYGSMKYASGSLYEGEWQLDKKCGKGVMVWQNKNELYLGEWKDDLAHGRGEHIWTESVFSKLSTKCLSNIYRGEWNCGARQGQGTFFFADGSQYTGAWQADEKHGQGVMLHSDGKIEAGWFVQNRFEGAGVGVVATGGGYSSGSSKARATDDVNVQFLLHIGDVLQRLDATRLATETSQDTKTQLERLLLRYTSCLRQIFREGCESANKQRKTSEANDLPSTDPHVTQWPIVDQTMVTARLLHKRFLCMTMNEMRQFALDVELIGPGFTYADLCSTLVEMRTYHRHATKSSLQKVLLSSSTSGGESAFVFGELVDSFFGPSDMQPDQSTDSRQPLREREFVELFVRSVAKKAEKTRDTISLYHSVFKILAEKVLPFTQDPSLAPSFPVALRHETVQEVLKGQKAKIALLWRHVINEQAKSTPSLSSMSSIVNVTAFAQFRYALRLFSKLRGSCLPSSMALTELLRLLGRDAYVEPVVVAAVEKTIEETAEERGSEGAKDIDGSAPPPLDAASEPPVIVPVPARSVKVDYSYLSTLLAFEDFVELLCRLAASPSWCYQIPVIFVEPTGEASMAEGAGGGEEVPSDETKSGEGGSDVAAATAVEEQQPAVDEEEAVAPVVPSLEVTISERLGLWLKNTEISTFEALLTTNLA